jgi:two-component system sensor histidine kinase UhpB
VEIVLQQGAKSLVLSISDNGRGLGPDGGANGGFGLAGIRERVRAAGGEMHLRSSRHGLTISVEVPIDAAREREEDPSLIGG